MSVIIVIKLVRNGKYYIAKVNGRKSWWHPRKYDDQFLDTNLVKNRVTEFYVNGNVSMWIEHRVYAKTELCGGSSSLPTEKCSDFLVR